MVITRKHIFSFILFVSFGLIQVFGASLIIQPAFASESLLNNQEGISELRSVFGWDPKSDVRVIIVNIIKIVLGFLGVIFLALMVFAGFRYMTSAGNEDQTKKALSQIKDAVIGLLIVLASWMITSAAFRYLTRAVNNNVQIFEK